MGFFKDYPYNHHYIVHNWTNSGSITMFRNGKIPLGSPSKKRNATQRYVRCFTASSSHSMMRCHARSSSARFKGSLASPPEQQKWVNVHRILWQQSWYWITMKNHGIYMYIMYTYIYILQYVCIYNRQYSIVYGLSWSSIPCHANPKITGI
jgi:hypothetical protein